MLSVLVTFFNQEEFVEKCLDSVLAQDYSGDIEIIVFDDGSSDKTVFLIDTYIQRFPAKITLLRNIDDKFIGDLTAIERVSRNRLSLLRSAKGDFVCFLDGDDFYCHRSFFSRAIEVLEDESGLVACGFEFAPYSKNLGFSPTVSRLPVGRVDKLDYFYNFFLHVGCFICRNSLTENQLLMFEKIGIFDDNVITLAHLLEGDFFHEKTVVYAYRRHDDGIFSSASEVEKCLMSILAHDILTSLTPDKSAIWLFRYFFSIKKLYSLRFEIKNVLGIEKYEKYRRLALKSDYNLLRSFLLWAELSFLEKLYFQTLHLRGYVHFYMNRFRKVFKRASITF